MYDFLTNMSKKENDKKKKKKNADIIWHAYENHNAKHFFFFLCIAVAMHKKEGKECMALIDE